MKGAVDCPTTIKRAMTKKTSIIGIIHHFLCCMENPKNSLNRLNRCLKKIITRPFIDAFVLTVN
jgi:hypothetical protein